MSVSYFAKMTLTYSFMWQENSTGQEHFQWWRSGDRESTVKESNKQAMITVPRRWGIQKLVSTYELPETPWPNFKGEGYSGVIKTQSAKYWPNFNFQGRGYSGENRVNWDF